MLDTSDLKRMAEAILLDKKNWLNEEGWVSRRVFYMLFLPMVDDIVACRAREQELSRSKNPKKSEPLSIKIDRGRRRIARLIESYMCKEFDPAKINIRLRRQNIRKNIKYTYQGKSLTVTGWSKVVKIKANTIHKRLSQGWTFEKAITTPLDEDKCVMKNASPGVIKMAGIYLDTEKYFPTVWTSQASVQEGIRKIESTDNLLTISTQRQQWERSYSAKKNNAQVRPTCSQEKSLRRALRVLYKAALKRCLMKGLVEVQGNMVRKVISASGQLEPDNADHGKTGGNVCLPVEALPLENQGQSIVSCDH